MKIEEILVKHPLPWKLNDSYLSTWSITDANGWRILQIVETDRSKDYDLLSAIMKLVSDSSKKRSEDLNEGGKK